MFEWLPVAVIVVFALLIVVNVWSPISDVVPITAAPNPTTTTVKPTEAPVTPPPPTTLEPVSTRATKNASPPDQLSQEVQQLLLNHAQEQLEEVLHANRNNLREARARHAEAVGIAPVRGCFLTMIRHSPEGLQRFHRLLINVRQQMPKMAGRYPFVAFHEFSAIPDELYRNRLGYELGFMRGTQQYGNSVKTHADEIRIAEMSGAQVVKSEDPLRTIKDAQVLTENLVQRVTVGDIASLQALAKRFVFPKTVTHPNPRIRDPSRNAWPLHMGDISGLVFVPMMPSEFGDIPAHVDQTKDWPYPKNSYWGVSYRHMCRFFGVVVFYSHFFANNHFDFYMRLDVDSYILATPMMQTAVADELDEPAVALEEADYFEAMDGNDAVYAFAMLHPQTQKPFMEDLWSTFDRITADVGTDKEKRSDLPFPRSDMVHYWDNVEIVDLNLFREQPSIEAFESDRVAQLAYDRKLQESCKDCSFPTDERIGLNPLRWSTKDFDHEKLDLPDDQLTPYLLDTTSLIDEIQNKTDAWDGYESLLVSKLQLAAKKDGFLPKVREQILQSMKRRIEEHNSAARRIKLFLQKFDESGGFYYHRWGDAEVRTLLVSAFVAPKSIAWLETLPYQHYMNFHCPVWTNLDEFTSTELLLLQKSMKHCEAEAMKTYGQDNKMRGSARMSPAEASHFNHAFEKHRNATGGWISI